MENFDEDDRTARTAALLAGTDAALAAIRATGASAGVVHKVIVARAPVAAKPSSMTDAWVGWIRAEIRRAIKAYSDEFEKGVAAFVVKWVREKAEERIDAESNHTRMRFAECERRLAELESALATSPEAEPHLRLVQRP